MENTQTRSPKATKILELIAQQIGVEIEDINDDDSLKDDLHMSPTDLTDFLVNLNEEGFDTAKVNLDEIDTVAELIENLTSDEL